MYDIFVYFINFKTFFSKDMTRLQYEPVMTESMPPFLDP